MAKKTLRSRLGAIRRNLLCSLHRRPASLGNHGPIVTFCFDDFPRTAYSVGGAILEQYGARGTYYVAVGMMGSSGEVGEQFRENDLHSLLDKGHEVGSQTFNHLDCRRVPRSVFRQDVRNGLDALRDLTGLQCTNFAYPFGHVTLRAKRFVGNDLTSCRSIIPGLNGPEIDLNLLRANNLYGDPNRSIPAEELILENIRQKSWLIFYTHDVRSNPSYYGSTPELFEAAVSFARQSGCRIMTVKDVLVGIGAQTIENGMPVTEQPASF